MCCFCRVFLSLKHLSGGSMRSYLMLLIYLPVVRDVAPLALLQTKADPVPMEWTWEMYTYLNALRPAEVHRYDKSKSKKSFRCWHVGSRQDGVWCCWRQLQLAPMTSPFSCGRCIMHGITVWCRCSETDSFLSTRNRRLMSRCCGWDIWCPS